MYTAECLLKEKEALSAVPEEVMDNWLKFYLLPKFHEGVGVDFKEFTGYLRDCRHTEKVELSTFINALRVRGFKVDSLVDYQGTFVYLRINTNFD